MNLCILIPDYNHASTLIPLLTKLASYQLPCIIIDDGSDRLTKAEITKAAQNFTWVKVITLAENQGKGVAMLAGFREAAAQNYTHALQIDADGQHAVEDVAKFIQLATAHPAALISGKPVYDSSVPKSRLHGRKITHFWVAIETWSGEIADAMCGSRIYPLAPTLAIMQTHCVGKRMDFDIGILVHLFWAGIAVKFIPTPVIYPQDGISHFHLWHDNWRITLLHTRLFFGMLYRIPRLLARKLQHAS